jgi:hypothetical protein
MAEFDHGDIKAQIVAILKANTSLFTTTAEANKLRKIEVGFPDFNEISDDMVPYAFVANGAGPFELITRSGSTVSNTHKVLIHTINYNIITVVQEDDARKAEEKLDDYQKLILDTLEVDNNLTGATSAVVDDSFPVRADHLPVSSEGKALKGRIITFRCIKTTTQ